MQKHLTLTQNDKGNDYIVGDIHGEYDQLKYLLDKVNFQKSTDRLFSVGDIIDRGPQPIECLELLDQPWFYMVKGNHEQMLIDSVIMPDNELFWHSNGGVWGAIYPPEYMEAIARKLTDLPLVITVENQFRIVHAELTTNNGMKFASDETIDNWDFDTNSEDNMLWGRNVSRSMKNIDALPVYVGHTIFKELTVIGNHTFMDQGGFYHKRNKDFGLAIINPKTSEYHKYQ